MYYCKKIFTLSPTGKTQYLCIISEHDNRKITVIVVIKKKNSQSQRQ